MGHLFGGYQHEAPAGSSTSGCADIGQDQGVDRASVVLERDVWSKSEDHERLDGNAPLLNMQM